MELDSSKINYFLIVFFTILLMPKWSDAMPMITEQRDHCGKKSVKEAGPGGFGMTRKLPWVVGVIAEEGSESRNCTGTIFTPRLVITSKYCAPSNPKNARYVIHHGYRRREPVVKVHLVEALFVVLEVSRPFEADFAICLAFVLSTSGLNDTVWTGSWIPEDLRDVPDPVNKESWTLVDNTAYCNIACRMFTRRCTCALSGQDGGSSCQFDEGKPVMQWNGWRWFLIGVVNKVRVEGGKCASEGRRDRLFQWITSMDSNKITAIARSNLSYYLGETGKPTKKPEKIVPKFPHSFTPMFPSLRNDCGKTSKEVSPTRTIVKRRLPWVVGIEAKLGQDIRYCTGSVLSPRMVLTSDSCGLGNPEKNSYVIYLNFGRKMPVTEVHAIQDSPFVVLVVTDPFDREYTACLPFAMSASGLSQSVRTASWTIGDPETPFAPGTLKQELWYLLDSPTSCDECKNSTERCTCARSVDATERTCGRKSVIKELARFESDEGKPVMQWSSGKLYLIGLVTNNKSGSANCVAGFTHEQTFHLFAPKDLREIANTTTTKPNFYLGGRVKEDETQQDGCGAVKKYYFYPQKQARRLLLPWVVAIRASLGTKTRNCVGVLIDSWQVLTASKCTSPEFQKAEYTIIYNSTDITTGLEIKVEQLLTKQKPYGESFLVLQLAEPVDRKFPICTFFYPYSQYRRAPVAVASWAFGDGDEQFEKDRLLYETWRLPHEPNQCEAANRSPNNETTVCAVADSDEYYACPSDLGSPVMQWIEGNWHLVGMVTNLELRESHMCDYKRTRQRLFELLKR